MSILHEGWWIATVLAVSAFLLDGHISRELVWFLWGLAGVVLFIFRDPQRQVPSAPLAVVSPLDGKITGIDTGLDPYLQRQAQIIHLRMNWWGALGLRSPIEGKILEQWLRPGPQGVYHFAMWIQTDEHDDVVVEIVGKALPLRLQCLVQAGARIGQGHACGVMRIPGRYQLYLPSNARLEVTTGLRVRAGSDILATLAAHV